MPVDSLPQLVDQLRQGRLLTPPQLDEVQRNLLPRFPQAKELMRALVERDWLTDYQAKQLLQGRGPELQLGSYVILERVGAGATGQVFKARHLAMNRLVALKVLGQEILADAEGVARFYREIEVASQISHPNIVHAYDAGPIGQTLVLAMEFVDGVDLERLVKESGSLPAAQAWDYIRQAARGLQHAHERGLIHRDIKPANLLLKRPSTSGSSDFQAGPWGLIKVLDLGLARLQKPAAASPTKNLTVLSSSSVMQGTPDYMAPEQAVNFHAADIRADIYSLGCTLYFLLAGQAPFAASTLAEKLLKHQTAEPRPIEAASKDVPPALAKVLRKMMAKRPADRYQLPGEVVDALPTLPFSGKPKLPPPPRRSRVDVSPHQQPAPSIEGPKREHRNFMLLGAGLVCLLLCIGLVILLAVHLVSPSTETAQPPAAKPKLIDPATALQDPGFEVPRVGTGIHDAFKVQPSGSPWAFNSSAGVTGNASGYTGGNPTAPQGDQVAFLQHKGTMKQSVVLSAGTYQLEFQAAQRKNTQASVQTFRVLVDENVLGTFTPSSSQYAPYSSSTFTVTAGSHTITFEALNPKGGDNTVFIDMVQIVAPVSPNLRYEKKGSRLETVLATLEANGAPSLRGKWHAIGYFDNSKDIPFATAHAPEKEIDLKKSYPGKGGALAGWKDFPGFQVGANIDLAMMMDKDHACIYLLYQPEIKEPVSMPVGFGSDDQLAVWLNRERLVFYDKPRSIGPDQDVATLHFKAGKNQLLLKVGNGTGQFLLHVTPRWPARWQPILGEQLKRDFP